MSPFWHLLFSSLELRAAEHPTVLREQPDSKGTVHIQPGVTAEELDVDTVEIDIWFPHESLFVEVNKNDSVFNMTSSCFFKLYCNQ